MNLFCLNGYEGEKIRLELNEIIGFPGHTSIEGGYDIICTLTLDAGCHHLKYDRLFSATGALYRFCDELRPAIICLKELPNIACSMKTTYFSELK